MDTVINIYDRMLEFEERITEARMSGDDEEMDRIVRLNIQGTERLKRKLNKQETSIEDWIMLGKYIGKIEAYRKIEITDIKEDRFKQLRKNMSSQVFDKIAKNIYSAQYKYISHCQLASNLGLEYSDLTDRIRKMIFYEFVSSSRYGRDTTYSLTKQAEWFCRKYKIIDSEVK